MIIKRVFVITVFVLLAVIVAQAVIIAKPTVIGRHEVTTSENAVLLAKAAIMQKYGEAEILQKEFVASIDGSNTRYWYVGEVNVFDNSPHVLIRRSDGKVILKWV